MCEMCGESMMMTDGCIPHKVLLEDGRVIDEPRHDPEGSLDEADDTCPDCAARSGEIHHPFCDWARQPDGSQILIESVKYWNPEEDPDPRLPESKYIFVVQLLPQEDEEYPPHPTDTIVFDALETANEWREREDWGPFGIKVLELNSELPPEF